MAEGQGNTVNAVEKASDETTQFLYSSVHQLAASIHDPHHSI
jgi:hypothetical protein